jgi:hypothetical protein
MRLSKIDAVSSLVLFSLLSMAILASSCSRRGAAPPPVGAAIEGRGAAVAAPASALPREEPRQKPSAPARTPTETAPTLAARIPPEPDAVARGSGSREEAAPATAIPAPTPAIPASAPGPRFDIDRFLAAAAKAGDEAAVAELEASLAEAAAQGAFDALVATMEAAASRPGTAPGLHLALAAAYGRKGLLDRQYAALTSAESAAKAPGIVFNLAAIYGRKELLAADPRASLCRLAIESSPSGASLSLDGSPIGVTPTSLIVSALEEHKLGISLEGYEACEKRLRLGPAARESVSASLVPKPARLVVATEPPGADLSLDGGLPRKSPATWEGLAPGAHILSSPTFQAAPAELYTPVELHLDLGPGESARKSIALVRGMASVALDKGKLESLPPRPEFVIDGTALSASEPVELSAGAHEISVRAAGYTGKTFHYNLDIGVKRRLTFTNLAVKLVPRGTMKIDGKAEDWSGIEPVITHPSGKNSYASLGGTDLSAGYICVDDQYIYWKMDFRNGKPAPGKPQRAFFIFCNSMPGFTQSMLKMSLFAENGTFAAHYDHYSFKAGDMDHPVYHERSTFDCRLGGDFLEGRIKLSAIRPYLSPGVAYQYEFWVYDNPRDRSEYARSEAAFFDPIR